MDQAAMEAKIASLEAELRKAQSFADPDLFNKLQASQKKREILQIKYDRMEVELRKAKSFADPELFDKLGVVQKQRETLTDVNRDLQDQINELSGALAAAKRDSKERAEDSRTKTLRLVNAKQAALDRLQSRYTSERADRLVLSCSARADRLEVIRLQRQVESLEADNMQKQANIDQLYALLTDVFKPTDKLLSSLHDIKRKQQQLQFQLEEVHDEASATEAEKAKIEADLESQRQAHNIEVERLKESYEARLSDLHTALQSHATLASSIEGMRDTFAQSSSSNSKFVRRQSLDNKIQALEDRIAGVTAPAAEKKQPSKPSKRSTAKKAPQKKAKKTQQGKYSANSAFAVGASDDEEDDTVANISAPVQSKKPVRKVPAKKAPAKKAPAKKVPKRKAAPSPKNDDEELDWLAMFDDAGNEPAFAAPAAKKKAAPAKKAKRAKKPTSSKATSQGVLKPSSKNNATSRLTKAAVAKKFPAPSASGAIPATLGNIDASPIGTGSQSRVSGDRFSIGSSSTVDVNSRRSTSSMFGSFLEAFKVPKLKVAGAGGARGSRRRR